MLLLEVVVVVDGKNSHKILERKSRPCFESLAVKIITPEMFCCYARKTEESRKRKSRDKRKR